MPKKLTPCKNVGCI